MLYKYYQDFFISKLQLFIRCFTISYVFFKGKNRVVKKFFKENSFAGSHRLRTESCKFTCEISGLS